MVDLFGGHPAIKPKHRREIYEDVSDLSRPSGSYYMMMGLATVIASYGLLIDSAAVVVGAMLVAPLMGPIFGIALALASGNRRLLWSSVRSEIFGIMIAVGVGVLIGLTPFRLPIGSEWLVRTEPTVYDLVIALASGFAGAYALIDERMSPAMPGVAVAVAVLPPLASCGLALAAARWEMAAGAGMLFVANFFAIQIAAAVVFSAFGMLRVEHDRRSRRGNEEGEEIKQFLKRFGVSLLVLGVAAWFMTNTLIGSARDRRVSSEIETTLSSTVSATSGARLTESSYQRSDDGLQISATVLTPTAFEPDQVARMEQDLEERLDRPVHLIVRSLLSRDVDREGAVFPAGPDAQLQAEERERVEFLRRASAIVSEYIAEIPGAELADVRRSLPDGAPTLTVVIRAPEPVSPERASEVQQALREQLDSEIDLIIRTSIIHDVTPSGTVHWTRPDPGETGRQALRSSVRTALGTWLSNNASRAVVRDVQLNGTEPVEVTAHILNPEAFTEDDVAAMEYELRLAIGRDVRLEVRYELGGRLQARGQ